MTAWERAGGMARGSGKGRTGFREGGSGRTGCRVRHETGTKSQGAGHEAGRGKGRRQIDGRAGGKTITL